MFEILTQADVEQLRASTRTPTADMQQYVEYINQTLASDKPDAVGVIRPEDATVEKEERLREANNTVARVKRAAQIAGKALIVTKVGDLVYFRATMDGETPNAGPGVEKRSRTPAMAGGEYPPLAISEGEDDGSDIPEVEDDEDGVFSADNEEAAAGGRRRR